MKNTDTKTQLLDAAQELVQTRGYNAFSYKDLAERIGIRTASIHYHFKAKNDLGEALIARYVAGLEEALADIDGAHESAKARLEALIGNYRDTESQGVICLCGSLAADLMTLGAEVQGSVRRYLEMTSGWIEKTLRYGVQRGEFSKDLPIEDVAATLSASLQGALLVSRATPGAPLAVDQVERTLGLLLARPGRALQA